MILKNKLVSLFLLVPLMGSDSSSNYAVQKLNLDNQQLKKEIQNIDVKIKVVEMQIRYKDSIDAIATKIKSDVK